MSDIAKVLAMKRPTLYHYFPDLGSIFEAVLDDLHAKVQRYIVPRMGMHAHPLDQLAAMLEAVVSFYVDRRTDLIGLYQLWAAASASDPERLIAREREFLEPQRYFLVELVRCGIERGTIAPCDPVGLVETCLSLVDGVQLQRVTRDPDLSPMLAFVREHLLGPLRCDPSGVLP